MILWGLLLLAIPWILHLLTKRRHRSTEWAAMRFLLEAMRKNSKRIRFEHLILLLVRTALLGLIVCALARPLWTDTGTFLGGLEPVHRILVLDDSYSMALEQGDRTSFDHARDLAADLVRKARQGDAFQLLRLARGATTTIISEPAYRKEDVLAEIDRMSRSYSDASLGTLLDSIEPLLKSCPEIPRKQIYFFSDLQRATWSERGDQNRIAAEFRKILGNRTRLVLVDVGVPESSNLGISSLSLSEKLVTPNRNLEVRGTIRSFGPTGGTRTAELWIDGSLAAQQLVTVESQAEVTVTFPLQFSSGGFHRLRMKISKDRLAVDDERVLAVDVKSEIRVLCVNGQPAGDEREAATYYLNLALAPRESPGNEIGLIHPHTIPAGELGNYDLFAYDLVFFCNVPTFDESEALSIEKYLMAGGTVVFGMGDRIQPAEYNRLFAQPGKLLIPAPIAERQGQGRRGESLFQISTGDLAHPMLNLFRGNPASGLGTAPFFEYYRSTVVEGDTLSHSVLSFNNGDPLLSERNVGKGRSFLFMSSFDESWSGFAIWPPFLPFVQEIVHYSAEAGSPELNVEVGRSVPISSGPNRRARIRKPDGGVGALESPNSTADQVLFDQVTQPGFYEVIAPSGQVAQVLGAFVPVAEGDLEKLTRAELAQGILSGIDFDYQTDTKIDLQNNGKPVVKTIEPARWLIFAGLYLLFVELLMAWDFRAGLSLLFPPLIPFWMLRRLKSR